MVHDQSDGLARPEGRKERHLVQILDDEDESGAPERAAVVQGRGEAECMTPSGPVHVDAVDAHATGRAVPARREERDAMTARGEPAEDLVQVDLGAARLRVLAVLPVDDEDPQSRPISRASASSTPFTNFALVGLP